MSKLGCSDIRSVSKRLDDIRRSTSDTKVEQLRDVKADAMGIRKLAGAIIHSVDAELKTAGQLTLL